MSMGSAVAFLLNHLGDALIGIYIAPLFTMILSSVFLRVQAPIISTELTVN